MCCEEQVVHEADASVMVYCRNAGSLIDHAIRLNTLGYYRLSLCNSTAEVTELLEAGRRFRFLIFDGFDTDAHALLLEVFARFEAIDDIIVVSDVDSERRMRIILWARSFGWRLQVLQAPLRDYELTQVVGCRNALGEPRLAGSHSFVERAGVLAIGECLSVCDRRVGA